ncbi:putative bifunctional diguanylate cyclase/phosphodiesterase [Parathalassolituus penaei]|uniref:EAL domain-containing protein n=1 Tax=Parathalassolituus penaei TaxID=2997323 RepID=A0A9X3EDH4_9GAMM|nr:EAL domain-containing protein [Parathalassolituus penaei]MCY0965171.1 EAL domain-containing protein [Parathalassolituus penaei]
MKSIRTAVVILSLLCLAAVAVAVFLLSLNEHKELYSRYVQSDLSALSENMANDLVDILNQPDNDFELKRYLLSLEPYPHVRVAAVYGPGWNQIDVYHGQAGGPQGSEVLTELNGRLASLSTGIHHINTNLIAIRSIGDAPYQLGYLVIVNDFAGPISESTHKLISSLLPPLLVLLVLLAIAFYLLGNVWLAPLSRLSEFAEKVSKTRDYSLQTPQGGRYEVKQLSNNIAMMMRVIQEESEVNREYVTLLEERKAATEYLANYDSLTGLANRNRFMNVLNQALQNIQTSHKHLAVMYVDLDGFKLVNDSLGHEVGDRLLEMVAERLLSIVPEGCLVSRHGGDEFLVLLEECPQRQQLEQLADLIVGGLMQKFLIASWEVRVSASVGVATTFDSGADTRDLIRNADVAMYTAKSLGKSRYSFFSSDMMDNYQRRIEIANNIETALSENEFSIYYQEKVDANGRRVGAEALARWNSKKLGFVSPAEFIPIAEQSGKVTEITRWVIERVCRDCSDVFSRIDPPFHVSINLSAHDLKKYHLIGFIKGTFLKYHIPRGLIEFEVTEHSYLDNLVVANRFFDEITALGCRVALDDFGTGYSSLSYLTKIPIDLIKIDKQFVDNIGESARDDALVITIIEMARRLGMELCAEGVETMEQRQFLTEHGCHMFQGYLFHKPMSLREYQNLLARPAEEV